MEQTETYIEVNGEDVDITIQWIKEVDTEYYPIGNTTVTETTVSYEPYSIASDDGKHYYEWGFSSGTDFEEAFDRAYLNGDIDTP
jgi:hypothetical protein